MKMAKLTGERPMAGATPDSLLAFHDAGYREMSERLGPGTVLDVGCGVGEQTARLAGLGRLVIGIDYNARTAIDAAHEWEPTGLRFAAMDGGRLGARARSIDWVCSSHIIEHFEAPEQHVAELARVATADGTALIITPNRPADFENPFHVSLFEAPELESLLALFFDEVTVQGL
jgi:2-polyprenyl-3-methyl-5-hydroxy-6-metoxy-1,4-benzoquinol methylase